MSLKVLMLTPAMARGYGVAEAVAMQVRFLRQIGVDCVVGCRTLDTTYADVGPRRVSADAGAVSDLAAAVGAGVVVAHGDPYFAVLPELTGAFRTVAYEYGDPTPELFPAAAAASRRAAVVHKQAEVYPVVSAVAAISEFIAADIGWPAAHVIRLGVEHVPDLGPKPWLPPRPVGAPLRVGGLMRLGAGEARYKGSDEFLALATALSSEGLIFELMGRGGRDDAVPYERAGVRVHLDASDAQRTEYLRDLDVFVTTSLWEGTNLPLVEAQALGTPGLAPDTGAHPEFTPLVFGTLDEMAGQLRTYAAAPHLLADHGLLGYRYVRCGMSWWQTAEQLRELFEGAPEPPKHRPGVAQRQRTQLRLLRESIAANGVREVVRYHAGRLRDRF